MSLPLFHCTNCREDKEWNAIKKMPLGNGRYTLVCDKCSMTMRIIEKTEADMYIKEFGAVAQETEILTAVPPTSNTPVAPIKKVEGPTIEDIAKLKKDLEEKAKAILDQLDNLKSIEDKIKKQ